MNPARLPHTARPSLPRISGAGFALALTTLTAAPAPAGGARSFKSGPIQITADGRSVWVVNPDSSSVSRIDTASDAVREFPLPDAAAEPLALSVREDGSEVWVTGHDTDRVYVLDGATGALRVRIDLPWGSGPAAIALSRDQRLALVALMRSAGLAVIDVAGHRLSGVLAPVQQQPNAIAWMEDGVSAWVTHLGVFGDIAFFSRVDVSGPRPVVSSVMFGGPATPQDGSVLNDPDPSHNVSEGGYLLTRAQLAQIPGVTGRNEFWLPVEYHNIHQTVYAFPPSSTNQTSLRRFDLATETLLNDPIRDKVVLTALQVHDGARNWVGPGWDAHIAGASDIAFSADGLTVWLVNEQSDDLIVVPAATPAFKPSAATTPLVEIDVGARPTGLAVSPVADVAYVANRLGRRDGVPPGRTVSVVDLVAGRELRQIQVSGEPYSPERWRGARLFHTSADPRISPADKIACASCHPGGEQDGFTWQLEYTPGLHGPRMTMSLRGLGRTHTPGQRDPLYGWGLLHLSGDRDEVQDFEHTFQGVTMGGTGFLGAAVNPELGPPNRGRDADLDALAAYVESIEPVRRSPHRAPGGALSEAAVRGATFFMGTGARPADAGCGTCHDPRAGFVDGQFHDVGQARLASEMELNARLPAWHVKTRSLLGAWDTPPWEGSASLFSYSMYDTLKAFASGGRHGALNRLTERQIADLIELVMSIDGDLAASDVVGARDVSPPRIESAEAASLTTIDVWFNEGVDPASAADLANWTLLEGATPVAITAAFFDPQNGDRVRLTTTLAGGCHTYTLIAGPIADLAATVTGGAANALDPSDPRNTRVLAIGDTLTVTFGGSGYESFTVPVHDAGIIDASSTQTSDSVRLAPAPSPSRGLVRFDWRAALAAAGGVASPADILDARFSIEPQGWGEAHPVEARRVLLSWSDVHASGTPAGGVSSRYHIGPSLPWNALGATRRTPGVDGSAAGHYDGANDSSSVVDTVADMRAINERLTFSGARVTDAFRFWYDNPGLDYGYLLQFAAGATHNAMFRSGEQEDHSHGPVLTLTYRVSSAAPPPPPGEVSGRSSARPLLAVKGGPADARVLLSFEDLGAAASSYNVYEGRIGTYYSHRGLGCNRLAAVAPAGRRQLSYTPETPSAYFLVTASGCDAEGPSDPDHPPALLDCAP